MLFFSSWSDASSWQSTQSNHFLQQGARIAAWTFKMCLHIQIDLILIIFTPSLQCFLIVRPTFQTPYYCMGQEPVKNKVLSEKVFDHFFKKDPRLIEQTLFVPELFSGIVSNEIKQVEKLRDSLPLRQLEQQIIDGLNERFTLKSETQNPIVNAKNQTQQKKNQNTLIYELQNIENFQRVLQKIQLNFQIGKELDKLVRNPNTGKKITVRKKVVPKYKSCLDKILYARGYLHFYLRLLKISLGSKDAQKRKIVGDFHENVGKMICQMIEFNHLEQKKMMQLFYMLVIADIKPQKGGYDKQLRELKEDFWPLYLSKEHSLTLDPAYFEQVRQISRCYLDELYLRSIKEAQDPDIVVEGSEGLGIVRNFPITRVKEKNR